MQIKIKEEEKFIIFFPRISKAFQLKLKRKYLKTKSDYIWSHAKIINKKNPVSSLNISRNFGRKEFVFDESHLSLMQFVKK